MPTVIAGGGKLLARIAAPILLAAGLCACSSIPDWVDPTTWIGGGQGTDDQSGTPDSAQAQAQGATPDLASIPPRPEAPSSADEQKQVANSLEADRAKAQYSADALRGGTESAASPPPAEPPSTTAEPTSSATPAPADAASTNAPPPASDAGLSAPSSADQAPPGASGAAEADATPASTPAAGPMAAESTSAPAAGDMQTTFAPSKAPALDPSVAQFVPQPILSRYQQTAAGAAAPGIVGATNPNPPAKHRHHKKTQSSNAARLPRLAAVAMDGDRRAEIFVQT